MNRRRFLQLATAGTAMAAFRRRAYGAPSPGLTKFQDSLPGLTSAGKNNLGQFIPVAKSVKGKYYGQDVDQFWISMVQYSEQMHSDLPNPTTLWGYADVLAGKQAHYLGPAIVAQRDTPSLVTYSNELPDKHFLPVDKSLQGAGPDQPENRTAPHLHGGFTPWLWDGTPMSWFTADNRQVGDTFHSSNPFYPNRYYYPNQQSARLLWYHDHAMGITRLNAYAGLAAPYVLRDQFEEELIRLRLIPGHDFEIPLVIQDKSFNDDGSLFYPSLYDGDPDGGIPPIPSCNPEFFADTIVVNGTCSPYVELKPELYRFRILNGSQARFYNLNLYVETYSEDGGPNLKAAGPRIVQIGTEGGFLPEAVVLNDPPRPIGFARNGNVARYNLLLAPAERADILIDFTNVEPGTNFILYNDAPAPFPGGDSANDHVSGASGPDTRSIMRITVVPGGYRAPMFPDGINLPQLNASLTLNWQTQELYELPTNTRAVTLNEDLDSYGRLVQRLGTNVSIQNNTKGQVTYGRAYMDDPTEVVRAGTVETWEIYNLTMDTHPIHFHLVNCRIVGRRPFDPDRYNGTPTFLGPLHEPDPNERGWKETVRCNPGEVLIVKMKFDLPVVPFPVPNSTRFGPNAAGHEYVWHCHILEHEEHDMMRPLVVVP